jgi:cytochrome c oxidase cbb3-type subunit 3
MGWRLLGKARFLVTGADTHGDAAPPIGSSKRRAAGWVALAFLGLGLIAGLTIYRSRSVYAEGRLLAAAPTEIMQDASLVSFANAQGAPLFAAHCATCHGADMKGNASSGAPNLVDDVWMFGDGGIFEIERTILFGIRTGSSKSRDVTEMPALGQRGLLTDAQIREVIQLVLKLGGRPYRKDAAAEGRRVFDTGDAACRGCHGDDGRGDSFSGASDLTAGVWNYGGDEKALYDSIYFGRRGVCPGWYGVLTLGQIRSLAVYIYSASHPGG